MAEGGRQRAESRGQRAESRGQRAEGRGERADDGFQKYGSASILACEYGGCMIGQQECHPK